MYFTMFIIFMALIIAPSVAGPKLKLDLKSKVPNDEMIKGLFQPNPVGYEMISSYHNDTGPIAANSDIIASESSVVANYQKTRTDGGGGGAKETDGSDSSSDSSDSSDSSSGGGDSSSDSSNSDGGVGGNEEDGFSGKRKLVRLL